MQIGYSPYRQPARFKKRPFPKLEVSVRAKRWIWILLGGLFVLFFILYLSLGELRFLAHHYLGLTFFRKHYVVLLQNNYELRPGGGFLTGYGEITTTLGLPTQINFDNSYRIDTQEYVTPPYPHETLLKDEWYQGYTFRDANWEPDFPKSAEVLKAFYLQKFPDKEVDGFLVLNFSLIEKLVDEVGGIELEGQPVTGQELFSLITQEVNNVDRHNEQALLERKSLLNPLAKGLIKKAKWHPFKVRSVLEEGLREKELYAWLENNRLQRRLEEREWANRLVREEGQDLLSLNLANLGAKKADRYLQKELHHFIDLTGPVPVARSELTFRLPGGWNQHLADYRGYLRLYLPAGVEVMENEAQSKVTSEEGFTVIGQELALPVGSTQTLVYKYSLPRSLWKGEEYDFHLVKQSGSELFAQVAVEVPAHQQMESSSFEARENRGLWRGELQRNEVLSLKLKPDSLPPYPIEQKFINLKTLVIDWNEPLEEGSARDATFHRLEDRNVANAEVTDEVKVIYAELTGSRLTLELEGVSEQENERYTLSLNHLRDRSGNATDPEILEVTLVQRLKKEEVDLDPEELSPEKPS